MPSRPQVFRAHGQCSTEQVRADSEANRGSARERGYRDSHTVFIDGHVVKDASAWRPGQQVNIANPVPYSRKIEAGRIKLSVPSHVYEDAALIIAGRYGNSVAVKFVFMPVRFGRRRGVCGVFPEDQGRAPPHERQGAPGLAGAPAGAADHRKIGPLSLKDPKNLSFVPATKSPYALGYSIVST